jgi:hypothetical protein
MKQLLLFLRLLSQTQQLVHQVRLLLLPIPMYFLHSCRELRY